MTQRPRAACRLLAIVAVLACSALPWPSQAHALEPDYQQWLQLQVDLKLPHKLLFNFDLQSRRMNAPLNAVRDGSGNVDYTPNPNTMLLMRPSLGMQLLPWLSGWFGYAFTPVFFDEPAFRDAKNISEHRVFEQLSTAFNLERVALSTRTRLEQRFRNDGPGSSENDGDLPNWSHRFRQLVRAQVTLASGKPWLLVVWDELFVHLNDTQYPSETGIDQNRAFAGVGYQASPELRVEAGYLNQLVRRFSDPHQLNHVLSVSLSFRFDATDQSAD